MHYGIAGCETQFFPGFPSSPFVPPLLVLSAYPSDLKALITHMDHTKIMHSFILLINIKGQCLINDMNDNMIISCRNSIFQHGVIQPKF